jgi:hypothetical protein
VVVVHRFDCTQKWLSKETQNIFEETHFKTPTNPPAAFYQKLTLQIFIFWGKNVFRSFSYLSLFPLYFLFLSFFAQN